MIVSALSRMNAIGFIAVLCAIAFALTGCFALAPIAMSTASFYSASATGKFPADHLVSLATGEDCAAIHIEAKQPYCIDRRGQIAGLAVEKRCYHTIGRVQCYLGPDPYDTRPDPVQDPVQQ